MDGRESLQVVSMVMMGAAVKGELEGEGEGEGEEDGLRPVPAVPIPGGNVTKGRGAMRQGSGQEPGGVSFGR